jgi:hypothetical protein
MKEFIVSCGQPNFKCDYGSTALPFARWFGTFRSGCSGGEGSKLSKKTQMIGQPALRASGCY